MKIKKIVTVLTFIFAGSQIGFAQSATDAAPRPTPPPPVANPTKTSENVSKYLEQINSKTPVSREQREQAYASLLEGQRHMWKMRPPSSSAAAMNNARLAKQSFQKAVEINPILAEGYTALAEITLSTPPYDLEEALSLAAIAVKIAPENFGAHRILARLYTIKSRLNSGVLDQVFAQKAIAEWQEIGRLDPRNAEAFAFLSEFYARTNKPAEQIDALNRWLASAAAGDSRFYGRVMGGQGDLSPESALVKLGAAQLQAGKTREAVEILSRAVADNPENEEAIELLSRAIESADESSSAIALQSLQQAVFANPENPTLVVILAQVQVRAGKIDNAAKNLRETSAKLAARDKISASLLQVSLGDIYARANRFDEAIAAFQTALTIRGIDGAELAMDNERDFAIDVFDKMIETYKRANRLNEAKAVIERARVMLGKADLFADKRLVSFYLETGKKTEALQAIRALRARSTGDFSLVRLEAEILTGSGRVDEAVELLKTALKKKATTGGGQGVGTGSGSGDTISLFPMYDEFSNLLFISSLYTQAKRGKEAVEAANAAYAMTDNAERKQIAKLTLATAQQMAGDYKSSEQTLREILKQSPENPIALNNLGYFLTERDEKLDEALKLIERAVAIDPANPSFLDSLGWAYFKLGKLTEAEKYLRDALRFDDSSSTIHEHLGDVYQKQGKLELAKTSWQKALSLSAEETETNRLKAKLAKNNSK